MPGLPFQSMPAAYAGTPQLLGNLRTKEDELVYLQQLGQMKMDPKTGVTEPVYTDAELQRGRDPSGRPVVEMNWDALDVAAQNMPDPGVTLIEQSSAALKQAMDAIGGKRQQLQSSIRPAEESAWRDAQIDLRTINESNLDAEQKKQRIRQLQASYEKKALGIRDGIRGDMEALSQVEQQTKAEIEMKRVTTQAKLQAVAGFGRKYGLSDEDITREQYEVLGIRLPQRKMETPVQRINELSKYRRAIEDVVLRTRYNKRGQLEEDISTTNTAKWKAVTSPQRAAELEQIIATDKAYADEITKLATGLGRPYGLAAAAAQTASPAASRPPAVNRFRDPIGMAYLGSAEYIGQNKSPIAQSVIQAKMGGSLMPEKQRKVDILRSRGVPEAMIQQALAEEQ